MFYRHDSACFFLVSGTSWKDPTSWDRWALISDHEVDFEHSKKAKEVPESNPGLHFFSFIAFSNIFLACYRMVRMVGVYSSKNKRGIDKSDSDHRSSAGKNHTTLAICITPRT